MSLIPDYNEAQKFLELLDDTALSFSFQIFQDQKDSKGPKMAQVLNGSFEELKTTLSYHNNQGCGIYVTINETDGEGRKKSNITRIRSFFVESDTGDLTEELPFEPTMVIKSKHGNHIYWVLREFSTDIDCFSKIQKALATKLKTDLSVCDPSRVLRLPGFYHLKDPSNPFMVKIIEASGDYVTLSEVRAEFGTETETLKTVEAPTAPKKGIILAEILDFFNKSWDESKGDNKIVYRAACNVKKNGYSLDECIEFFERKGQQVNYNTRNQISAIYRDDNIEVKPYYGRTEKSYKDLIWSSKIYKNMENGDTFIYDEEENATIETPEQILRETLSSKFYQKKLQLCSVEYLPFRNEVILTSDRGFPILNKYNKPAWKKSALGDCEMPEVYESFFDHLFGDYPSSREYVLNWIAYSLKGKNIPVLAMVGTNRGVGKNVMGNLLMALHGKDNYSICKQALLNKEFNMQVANKTLVHLDEVSVTNDKELESIKAYTNKTISIEGKGVESATRPFFGNLFLTNNKLECLSSVNSEDDRQFSVVEVTEKKLSIPKFMKYKPSEFGIDWMWEDAELIEQLGCHLWNRDLSKYDFVTNFKSPHYHNVIKQSQFEYVRLLLEDIRFKHLNCAVKLTDIKSMIKKMEGINLGRTKIETFCNDHKTIAATKALSGVRYLVYAKENELLTEFRGRIEKLSPTDSQGFEVLRLPKSLID